MKRLFDLRFRLPIRYRVPLALALAIVVAGAGLVGLTNYSQRQSAITQARNFAQSLHQVTLAGLTAMMITGDADRREVFLDQIERANDVRALRVVRGPAVAQAFGPGTAQEQPRDDLERAVIANGLAVFEVRSDARGEYLKAVMPAVGTHNSLGKDCLGCHQVPEGTVLGAVTLEIDLERVNESIAQFRLDVMAATFLFLVLLSLLSYMAVTSSVSTPLRTLTRKLDALAKGDIESSKRLVMRGSDEIAQAVRAFDQVLAKARLMLQTERISADVFDHALEGILVADAQHRIVKVNAAFTKTTGYEAHEVLGKNPRMLQSGQHDKAFYEKFWEALNTRGEWQGDIWNKRKNGEIYPEWLNISQVRDEKGELQHYVAIFSDITERKRQEALITYQAHHDALTGLPNRTLFRDRLSQALAAARRNHARVGVMFLDLDRFKLINDTLGHDVGDELLRQVAARLKGVVREADTVARLGGDEFTVLLPEIDSPRGAQAVGAKILEVTRKPYVLDGKELYVTSSVGIALYPEHGLDPDVLMKNADTAMYHIKEQGRAGCSLYDAALGARVEHHLQVEGDLHRAVENGELRVHYQPQLSLSDRRLVGVEALLRWQHPVRGMVPAREFMALAEESGLIIFAGEWALRTACADAARWAAEGRPVPVTVNLSPRQLAHHRLVDIVRAALEDTQLPPRLLELEITEGEAMHDVERAIGILQSLAKLGVRLAISEFGARFHAATHDLNRMPVDAVKIDRALVRDLARDPEAIETAIAMARMRRSRGVSVVAIGVESRQQYEILQTMRCDAAQGRYLGMAVPAEALERLISEPVPG